MCKQKQILSSDEAASCSEHAGEWENRKWLLIKSLGSAPYVSVKWVKWLGWFLTLAGVCHCNLPLLFWSLHTGISASLI